MVAKREPRVDPRLRRQLGVARGSENEVRALFELRPKLQGPDVETHVRDLVRRVAEQTGHPAGRVNVLRNVGAFLLSGKPELLEGIIASGDVASATLSEAQGSAMIPPRDVHPADGADEVPLEPDTDD